MIDHELSYLQVISSVDSSPEILAQIQEVIIPIVVFTFEHKLLGVLMRSSAVS